jgi:hypothetical protein
MSEGRFSAPERAGYGRPLGDIRRALSDLFGKKGQDDAEHFFANLFARVVIPVAGQNDLQLAHGCQTVWLAKMEACL